MSIGRHVHEHRVRVKETAWDHIYFGTVFTWFEVGRSELSRTAGMPYSELTRRGIGNFVVRACARYSKPIPATGSVLIETRLVRMSRLRFTFAYDIRVPGDERPRVTGYTEHASADISGKLARIPDEFLAVFEPTGETLELVDDAELERNAWTHNIRVRYEETDAFGVTYNGNYFAWMEAAWSSKLMGGPWDVAMNIQEGRTFAVAEASCRYLSPVTYDEPVSIEVVASPVGRTRARLDYRMVQPETSAVLALGHTLHAVVIDGKASRVPADLWDGLGVTP